MHCASSKWRDLAFFNPACIGSRATPAEAKDALSCEASAAKTGTGEQRRSSSWRSRRDTGDRAGGTSSAFSVFVTLSTGSRERGGTATVGKRGVGNLMRIHCFRSAVMHGVRRSGEFGRQGADAEGATAPESLRQKDRLRGSTLKRSRCAVSLEHRRSKLPLILAANLSGSAQRG